MRKNKMNLVITDTFWELVKSKGYLIATISLFVGMLIFLNLDKIIEKFSVQDDEITVQVHNGIEGSTLDLTDLNNEYEGEEINFEIAQHLTSLDEEEFEDAIESDALIYMKEESGEVAIKLYKAATIKEGQLEAIYAYIKDLNLILALNGRGIEEAFINELLLSSNLEIEEVDIHTGTESNYAGILSFISTGLLCMFIYLYGMIVANQIASEKSSRAMEILLSSMTPIQHMFGKIIGLGLAGILQLTIIGVLLIIVVQFTNDSFDFVNTEVLGAIEYDLIVYVLCFFVLGYLFYACMFAMVGSLVNQLDEVNQYTMPLSYAVFIAFIIGMFGLDHPDHPIINVASYIPFFTPIIMPLRIGLIEVSFIEIISSGIIMLISIFIIAMLTSIIYKKGVLIYTTQSKLFKNIFKLVKND